MLRTEINRVGSVRAVGDAVGSNAANWLMVTPVALGTPLTSPGDKHFCDRGAAGLMAGSGHRLAGSRMPRLHSRGQPISCHDQTGSKNWAETLGSDEFCPGRRLVCWLLDKNALWKKGEHPNPRHGLAAATGRCRGWSSLVLIWSFYPNREESQVSGVVSGKQIRVSVV